MSTPQNSVTGQLTSFVERVERLRAEKKQVGLDEAEVIAEAKAAGFVPGAIRHVVKLRAMKPHARQEAEALVDTYLHALGMEPDVPLHRQVGLIKVDRTSRESVIEALKAFVPDNGSIVVDAGGKPVKLTRDKDGTVTASDVVDLPFRGAEPAPAPSPAANRAPPPDVDADAAEALGREAYRGNVPVIGNPFPYGDARRARWDEGWRGESGTDGMGPDRKP